jgi:hypothetical protein
MHGAVAPGDYLEMPQKRARSYPDSRGIRLGRADEDAAGGKAKVALEAQRELSD